MKKFIVIGLIMAILSGGFLIKTSAGEIRNAEVVVSENGKPPMFVLQVGVSKYKNPAWQELKGAVTDVDEMGKVLRERFKVPEANIAEPLLNNEATKQKIFAAFENHLVAKAKEYFDKTKRLDAVVLFQFSGHGSQVDDIAPNKDEADGKDETFVTYDSEDTPNKNFDITDDEIYALTQRLGQYTKNIVFILDSCHSGSGTRDGGDARNVKPRRTQPVAVPIAGAKNVGSKTEKDNEQADILPEADDKYIVISAAKANERAIDRPIFKDGDNKPIAYQGRMTYYLLKALREAGETTTYRDLMDSVSRDVASETDTQTPQLEGESLRPVFGGLSRIEDNTIQISIGNNKEFFLEAGAMQGVLQGAILELRKKTGEKIGTAKVTQAIANRAVFETIPKDLALTAEDRAVIVSQDLTAFRLRVLLDGENAAKITSKDKDLIVNLRRKFSIEADKSSHGIDLTNGQWNDRSAVWEIALLKDRFDKVFPDKSRAAPIIKGQKPDGELIYEEFPSAETQVFYLAGKDFSPVYGFFVEADKNYTETVIEKALLQIVRLRSVKAIANNKSTLRGKIQIKPVRLVKPLSCENRLIAAAKRETPILKASETAYKFAAGEPFWLEITNTSGVDLYITVLDVGSDGSVKIIFPRNTDGEQNGFKLEAKAGKNKRIVIGEKCSDEILTVTPPAGIETFKVIATTEPAPRRNFQFLEMSSLNAKGRDGKTSLVSAGDWTTAEINFEITVSQE